MGQPWAPQHGDPALDQTQGINHREIALYQNSRVDLFYSIKLRIHTKIPLPAVSCFHVFFATVLNKNFISPTYPWRYTITSVRDLFHNFSSRINLRYIKTPAFFYILMFVLSVFEYFGSKKAVLLAAYVNLHLWFMICGVHYHVIQ